MLTKTFLSLIFIATVSATAQTVDVNVKDITPNTPQEETGVGKESDGAIIIKKGKLNEVALPKYEITQGDEEILGDAAPLLKDARANWKKACADWKKEMRDNNKDNQVIAVNCGSMSCSTATAENICRSKGIYKLKVKTGH